MVSLPITAGAVDVYSTTPEAAPLLKSPALMAVYDSGVSVAAVEPSDLDDYLKYGNYTVAQFLIAIMRFLTGSTVPNLTGTTLITQIDETFSDYLETSGWYLDDDGDVNNINYNNSVSQLVRLGFLGLSQNLKSILTSISNLNITDYSPILTAISNSVDGLESGLTSANTAIGGVNTSINNGFSTLNFSVGTVNTSVGAVNTSVGVVNSSVLSLSPSLVQIRDRLTFSGGGNVLSPNGISVTTSSNQPMSNTLAYGLLGLSANIKGSETDNVYTSTLYDNNNSSTSVNSTGLGPLLNNQLSNIGENLGHLAYVFANDEDIKLREDSQPLLDSTDSFYDDSDSNVKVSANNVGSLKDIAGNFTSIIDADADIGDAFAIVSNSNTYRWFSADVAMDLDSLGVATADYEESTYDRLHREFNEIYFPDRVGGAS